jgi:hypothetical protein
MADFSNINQISVWIEPYTFTDNASGGTKYFGMSASFPRTDVPVWRIKKEWTVGTVTYMGFPDGNQEFKFIWDCRTSYNYL